MFNFLKSCIFGFPHEKFSQTLHADILRLELKESDILVLNLDFIASLTQKNKIKYLFEKFGIDNELLFLDKGMNLTILSNQNKHGQ